jgi:DNA processing protein
VIEAGGKSGALITAMLAVEYNRDVGAVPGAVTNPKSAGCHGLIKTGAALIEKSEDVLQLLRMRTGSRELFAAPQVPLDLPDLDSPLIRLLDHSEAMHIDHIAAKAGMPVGETLGQLLLLELKGTVRQLPGKYFVRA